MHIFALADDLTGALEVGAKFAARGIASEVTTDPKLRASRPVHVVDTETRHLPGAEAAAAIAEALHCRADLIFKKTDSTLRGNIAAELSALSRGYPDAALHYIPAYPRMGRTVRSGQLLVHGVPVHQTAFARDPLNPVRDSSVASASGDVRCTIHDGECDADIARSVAAALSDPATRIIAGPASVAEALAAHLQPGVPDPPQLPKLTRVAIVNGSLHPASTQQIAWAIAHGHVGEDWRVVKVLPAMDTLDALLVFGGDTAFGILRELNCRTLEPVTELLPGVPLARLTSHNLYFITKAGGFGDLDVIGRLKEILDA